MTRNQLTTKKRNWQQIAAKLSSMGLARAAQNCRDRAERIKTHLANAIDFSRLPIIVVASVEEQIRIQENLS